MISLMHALPFQSLRLCNSATSFFLLPPPSLAGARRLSPTVHVTGRGGVRFHGPLLLTTDIDQNEVVFENCVTRNLPPALTLEEGLEKIKEAIQLLKSSPSPSSTGFLRFQVAVPPSPKALSWFCCQPESSGVFPLIFVSKNMDNPTFKALHVNGSRGVFGIGTAVSFAHSSPRKQSLIRRFVRFSRTGSHCKGRRNTGWREEQHPLPKRVIAQLPIHVVVSTKNHRAYTTSPNTFHSHCHTLFPHHLFTLFNHQLHFIPITNHSSFLAQHVNILFL
ncbi:putative 2-succinyl-5-enolpyruvyl-6-hydroxy-3-cyclohexene-1-carboxylic-acid synthase [Lupinus albus]|uniref:Putative 2-succinyl-5-enolpyruvyl-6-hydroxy-3-cyclohexene-1-carboxylic-acid synthase n=1 Tax=Lupinus albus TaxID=3870 RepID=A0A6A4PAQ5_LUPAL|nr:putative 2-succinyl-5-enolpyruvyl-6-hydroxy-3-cyclohexene-1-carboxylic-acid synthase [Lupinus albus]